MSDKLKFVGAGHKAAVQKIVDFLDTDDPVFLLTGEPGMGKSRVLEEFMNNKLFQGDSGLIMRIEVYGHTNVESTLDLWMTDLVSKRYVFRGNREWWSSVVKAIPKVGAPLGALFKDKTKSASQRFIEAMHMIGPALKGFDRLVFVIDPFKDLGTDANASVIEQFARESVTRVKFVIGQRIDDRLAESESFQRLVGRNVYQVVRLTKEEVEAALETNPGFKLLTAEARAEFIGKVGGWALALDSYARELATAKTTAEADTIIHHLPRDLAKEIRKNYRDVTGDCCSVIDMLALLGMPVDLSTLSGLTDLPDKILRDTFKDPQVDRLVETIKNDGRPSTYQIRHALYAEWIVDELRRNIDVGARYVEIAEFFKNRFGDDKDRSQDLIHHLNFMHRSGNKKAFLDAIGEYVEKLYLWALHDAHLDLEQKRLAAAKETGERRREAHALNEIGLIFVSWGKYDLALDRYEKSLAIKRKIGDRVGEGATLSNIAAIHHARSEYQQAVEVMQQSLAIIREVGDREGEGGALNNISQVYRAWGKYDEALQYLQQSLAISREIGDRAGEGTTLNNIATNHFARGEYQQAIEVMQQSLETSREIGNRAGEGTTLNNISQVYRAWGKYDEALQYLQQSLEIFREIGDRKGEGTTLSNIATIHHARGEYKLAIDVMQQSLTISREIGDRAGEAVRCFNIASIYERQGLIAEAVAMVETTVAIDRDTQHPDLESDSAYLARLRAKLAGG